MNPNNVPIFFDLSATPAAYATNRAGNNILSPQGGLITLGSDYGSTPKAQIPKVDSYGSQYVTVANPAGAAAQVYSSQAAPTATSQYGNLTMARQDLPTPSSYYPLNLDMQMSLNVHHKSKPTFRAIAKSVSCSANAVLMAFYNGSSMVMRINEISIYVPPSGSSGALLGSTGATYYPLICELQRTTTYTGGTSITPMSGDTADSLATGTTVASKPSAITTSQGTFHRQDAIVTNCTGLPWYGRGDRNEKTYVVRPGEGFSIICISNGTINNASGSATTTASIDIELTFTQAVA